MTASERIRAARENNKSASVGALPQTPRETRGLVEVSRSLIRDASGLLQVVTAHGYPLEPWVDPLTSKCDPL